jgi:hypothetical protein
MPKILTTMTDETATPEAEDVPGLAETRRLNRAAHFGDMNPDGGGRKRTALIVPNHCVLGTITDLLPEDEPSRATRFYWEARPVTMPHSDGYANTRGEAMRAIRFALTRNP